MFCGLFDYDAEVFGGDTQFGGVEGYFVALLVVFHQQGEEIFGEFFLPCEGAVGLRLVVQCFDGYHEH